MARVEFPSKVVIPKLSRGVILRRQLLDYLHRNIDRKLTVVRAGAGYGKTTLLVQFAGEVDFPVYWCTLDNWDSEPSSFFQNLVWAVKHRSPEFGQRSISRLAAVRDFGQESRSLVSTFLAEVQDAVGDYCVFVLDDYHHVVCSEAVNTLLDLLVSYAPDNVHFIISSRTHLSLSVLPRLVANRQAGRLTASNLRFTREEVQHFFLETANVVLSEAELQALVDASEGWPVALVLARLSEVETGKLSLRGQDIFDYLATEVFLQQAEPTRAFLVNTSVLPELRADLCDRLLKEQKSSSILANLAQDNALMSEGEGEPGVYECHDLFRQFLSQRLKLKDPRSFAELHVRAGKLLEGERQWKQAVESYMSVDRPDLAASLLETVGEELMAEGKWRHLASAIELLPPDSLSFHPGLLVMKARAWAETGESHKAIQLLSQTLPSLEASDDTLVLAKAYLAMNIALRFVGRVNDALTFCQKAKAALISQRAPREWAQVINHLGICHALQRNLNEAQSELQDAVRLYEEHGDTFRASRARQDLGNVYTELGNVTAAIAQYETALKGWERLDNEGEIAWVLNNLGALYFIHGEWDLAHEMSERAMQKADAVRLERAGAYARVTLGDVLFAKGMFEEAVDLYTQGAELARTCEETRLLAYATDGLSRTYLRAGEVDKACVLIEKALALVEHQGESWEAGLYSITSGVILYEGDDYVGADKVLKRACHILSSVEAPLELARARLHLSYLCYLKGEREEAFSHLEVVARAIEDVGHYYFLLADTAPMREFLEKAAIRDIGGGVFLALLRKAKELCKPDVVHAPIQAGRTITDTDSATSPQIEAYAFGAVRVMLNGEEVSPTRWRSPKAKELFFYLAHQGRPIRREKIIDALWPELPPGQVESNFKSCLFRARHALYPDSLQYTKGYYRFSTQILFRYDAADFKRLVDMARKLPKGGKLRAAYLQEAVSLYLGPFLEEFYSEWCESERSSLESEYVRALAILAGFYAGRKDFEAAAHLCESILQVDALNEDVYYNLVTYYASGGNRAAAIRAYQKYEALVRHELGAKPSAQMERLYASVCKRPPSSGAPG